MNETPATALRARPPRHGSTLVGPVAATATASAVILLRSPKPLAEAAARVVQDRQPLAYEDFVAQFKPSDGDVAAVLDFAKAHGLESAVDHAARTVTLKGPAAAVQNAFGVTLNEYDLHGVRYRTHEQPIQLPPDVAGRVQAIFELSNPPVALSPAPAAGPPRKKPAGAVAATPPWTAYPPPTFLGFYDVPAKLTGKGRCVGTIEIAGGFSEADMKAFFTALGLSVPMPVVVGANVLADDPVFNLEVTLDLQIICSCAPEAVHVAYLTGVVDPNKLTFAQVHAILAKAIFDQVNKPDVLTISVVFAEDLPEKLGGIPPKDRESLDELLAAAAILGITFCAPAGDTGSTITAPAFSNPSMVYYPGSSLWSLCCGGTTLEIRDGARVGEVVWNRLAPTSFITFGTGGGPKIPSSLGATGGGVSEVFALPDWQAHAGVPLKASSSFDNGVFSDYSTFAGRGCPDVAANADFWVAYQFYYDGAWRAGGGTSASTPFIASVMTLLAGGVGKRLGFVNPHLYRLQIDEHKHVFRTVAHGNNGGYTAHEGQPWNACTGLGAPIGAALLGELAAVYGGAIGG